MATITEEEGEESMTCEEGEIIDDSEKEKEENDRWTLVVNGPRKRKSSQVDDSTQLKGKKKRRRMCYMPSDVSDSEETTAPPLLEPNEQLTQNQKGLLRYLSEIASRRSSISPESCNKIKKPSTQFKTADFQSVLRHILTGEPGVVGKKGHLVHIDVLRTIKVAVIWLSCVSRIDYVENGEECFSGLKSLINGQFQLLHPGSDKFVHFGLESFMELEEKVGNKKTSSSSENVSTSDFTRKHCLLTHHQLIENEFPLPLPSSPLFSPLPPSPTLPTSSSIPPSLSPTSSLPPTSLPISLPISSQKAVQETEPPPLTNYITLLEEWPSNVKETLQDLNISQFPIYSIDCEMVKTELGSELARVSIIDENLSCVYTSLVKPDRPVLDYLTRFSGVDEEMLSSVQVNLKDVQCKLKQLLPSKCILIGHSLENDLIALQLYHPYIIDTSLLFAPAATPRSKPSLKKLVKQLLNKDIQASSDGHDPTEDALACMELVKKKLSEGPSCVIQWNQSKKWLPVHLSSCGVTNRIIDKQSLSSLYTNRSETSGLAVSSDKEAAQFAISEIHNSRFIFVQFHSFENLKKEKKELSKDEITSTLTSLDKLSCDVINTCPKGTLVLVVCGSNNIRLVRELQRDPNSDTKVLKKAVKDAREGIVLVTVK